MKKVAIIIPVYNSGEYLRDALDSIIKNTDYPNWRMIIVESESTDGTDKVCDEYAKRYSNIEIYHTKKEGITKAINFGISKTTDEDIYLSQDDVIIHKLYKRDWLTLFVKASELPNAGLITVLNGGGVSGIEYLEGFHWIGTWSLYIPRKTIEKIGVFDENFSPGPGDDICFSYRVIKSGLKIYVLDFCVDHHRLTENFNDKIEFIKMRNAGYFRKKHGLEPYWEEFDLVGNKVLLDSLTNKVHCFFKRNSYEIEHLESVIVFADLLNDFKDNDVLVDCGAGVGCMSLLIKKGRAIAYEANGRVFDILKLNAWLNKSEKKITVLNKALYSKEMGYTVEENALEGLTDIVENPGSDKKTIVLDEDLKLNQGERVKVLKIDCEKSTNEVLLGAKKIIEKFSPILFIERPDEKIVADLGYKKKAEFNGCNWLMVRE